MFKKLNLLFLIILFYLSFIGCNNIILTLEDNPKNYTLENRYATIKTSKKDKILISSNLFEKYIKIHSTDWAFVLDNNLKREPLPVVIDYKINDINIHNIKGNKFTALINYDVQAANETDGWYAGNGIISDQNWIIGKINFVDIERSGNTYSITNVYTG